MMYMFALVLLGSAQAQADSSCTARSLGATSMLAIQHTASKSKTALVEDDTALPREWYQTRAEQHVSGKAGLIQETIRVSHALQSVERLESNLESSSLSDKSTNATHHATSAAAHNESTLDYEKDETKRLCRTCAEAGHSLMSALHEAVAAHATAEVKAVAMAAAKDAYEASSQKLAATLDSFQDVLKEHQDIQLTYRTPKADFEKMCTLANSMAAISEEAVQTEAEQGAHKEADEIATGIYQQAHAATEQADEKVAGARVVEEQACKDLGLPPLPDDPTSCMDIADKSSNGWFSLFVNGQEVLAWCDFTTDAPNVWRVGVFSGESTVTSAESYKSFCDGHGFPSAGKGVELQSSWLVQKRMLHDSNHQAKIDGWPASGYKLSMPMYGSTPVSIYDGATVSLPPNLLGDHCSSSQKFCGYWYNNGWKDDDFGHPDPEDWDPGHGLTWASCMQQDGTVTHL